MDVIVKEAFAGDAVTWHDVIQKPFIRGDKSRIDRNWNWKWKLFYSEYLEKFRDRRIAYFQIVTEIGPISIPIGQVMVSVGYPFLPDTDYNSVFMWYITAAPPRALAYFGLPVDIKLLRPLIDIGVEFSYATGFGGRICLHADPSGTSQSRMDLYRKYQAIGLQSVQSLQWRLTPWRRNDGRYFFADEQTARSLSAAVIGLK